MSSSLTVIIPAWNESQRIGATLDHLIDRCQGLDIAEVIVVNDGSSDDTAELVRARAQRATGRCIRLIEHERNQGKGAALRTGLAAARTELIGYLDADLSVGPEPFKDATREIEAGADVIVGVRISHTGRADGAGQPWLRGQLSRLFKRFQRRLIGLPLQDTQCPFKLFTSDAVARTLPRCTSDGWGFDVEVLLVADRSGLRVREIPVPWHFVGGSTVRANPLTAWRTLREVLAIRRRHGSV
ncbi:MAG: dolichyl-phosphate beta-glucosyltransferase [Dehalococcoidia bacterium]